MFILRFFFVFFLLLVFLGIVGIVFFVSTLGNIKRQFDRMARGKSDNKGSTYSWNRYKDPSIRDNRTEEQRNKRIFSDTDGEYVDFEEIK